MGLLHWQEYTFTSKPPGQPPVKIIFLSEAMFKANIENKHGCQLFKDKIFVEYLRVLCSMWVCTGV